MIGATSIAAGSIAGTTGDSNVGVVVVLNGLDVSTFVVPDSVTIDRRLNSRSTCRVVLRDTDDVIYPTEGETVEIRINGARWFKGTIDEITEENPLSGSGSFREIELRVVSFDQLAERFIVAAKYRSKDVLLSSTLATGIDADDTLITVTSDASLPVAGPFSLQVWNDTDYPNSPDDDPETEIVRVPSSYSGGTSLINVVRGTDDTMAHSHNTSGKTYKAVVVWHVGDVVQNIVNEQTQLSAESVTIGNVDDGPIVDDVTFNYVSADKALDDLAKPLAYVWWIDEDRKLYFQDRSTAQAPIGFSSPSGSSSLSRNWRAALHRRSRRDYRNRQWLRAGKGRTDERTETFIGDGQRRAFDTVFELAEKPRKVMFGTMLNNDVTDKLGIAGVDPEDQTSTFEWFYEVGSTTISRNANLPAPTTSQQLQVTYFGLFDLVVRVDNPNEQTTRATIEGGTGIYENVEDDDSIDGVTAAQDRAQGILAAGDDIHEEITLQTDEPALFREGQLVTLDIPEYQVTGQWLIRSMTTQILGHSTKIRNQLRLISDTRISSEADFWRKLFAAGRKFRIRENEKLHRVIVDQNEIEWSTPDVAFITEGTWPLPNWDIDGYSACVYGISTLRCLIDLPYGATR